MPQDVLAFNQESLSAVFDLEVWPTILDDMADTPNARKTPKVSLKVMLRNATTYGGREAERPGDYVENLIGRKFELQLERVWLSDYGLTDIAGNQRTLDAV
jgi:hypothetical protein